MGSAPVKSAPVNDPKKEAVCGAKVVMRAAATSGTIIMPPGTLSTPRLILMLKNAGYAAATGFVNRPMPSISTSTRSPACKKTGGFRANPTPCGVPVLMTSPG